jgi:hypothetical protein
VGRGVAEAVWRQAAAVSEHEPTAAIGEALASMSRRDPAETAPRAVVPVSIDGHAEPIG